MSQRRSLMTDIIGVFNTNIAVLLIGFLIGIILPRALGPEAIGIYYAILVVPQLAHSLIDLGTRPAIVFLAGKKIYGDDKILSSLIFVFAISTTACLLIFSGVFWYLDNPDYQTLFIIVIMMITPLRLMTAYASAFILAKEKIRKFNRMNWLFPICNLIGILVFVLVLDLSVLGALLAVLFASFVVAVYAAATVFSKIRPRLKFDFGIIANIYKKGIVYAFSFFIIRLNYRVDIFLMERLSTFRETGYYSLGVNVAELIFQIPTALWIVIVSRAANASDQEAMTRTVLKLLRVAFLAALVCSALLFLVAPWAVPLVYGAKFLPSISVVQYILPGILFVVIFKVLNGHLSGIGKPWISALTFLPSVVINIGLNIWWIPRYGAFGAVMATNISYTLGAFALLVVYSRIMKVSLFEILKFRRDDFGFIKTLFDRLTRRKNHPHEKENA